MTRARRVAIAIGIALALAGAAAVAYFNYDVRYAIATVQDDTPEARVRGYLDAVLRGDEPAAVAAWRIRPTAQALGTLLEERRAAVTRALIERRPRAYEIRDVEWWSMCCEPHIIAGRRFASGARYTVDVDGATHRIDVFAERTADVYDGLPATGWVVRDVYPATERPLYNTFPGR